MTADLDDTRFEVKLVGYESQRRSVEHWLHLHADACVRAFPDRWVNSVYFDTHDFGALRSNLGGENERSKVRYRWYGADLRIGPGVLEVKQKRDRLGWKLRFEVNDAPARPGEGWKSIGKNLRAQLPIDATLWLDEYPVPMIINRYHRQYFVSASRRVRVTIDSRLTAWNQRHSHAPSFRGRSQLPDVVVVEVKADQKDRAEVAELVQGLPLRVGRNSKYVSAVMSSFQ